MSEASNEPRETTTATVAPPKKSPRKRDPKPLPPWKVLLHNDDVNEMGFVVETVQMLAALNRSDAVARTLEAHLQGVTLLLTTHRERAELYKDQFTSRGLTVTIEPTEA